MLKLREGFYIQELSVRSISTSGNTVIVRYDRETAVLQVDSNDEAVQLAGVLARHVEVEQAHRVKPREGRAGA